MELTVFACLEIDLVQMWVFASNVRQLFDHTPFKASQSVTGFCHLSVYSCCLRFAGISIALTIT
jgi:hypothetical protein